MTSARSALLLLPILLLAASLRLYGLGWDDGYHLHPDERFISMVVAKIRLPSSVGQYFDTARSPLNPYNNEFNQFAYGTLPLFLGRFIGALSGFEGYDRSLPLGRALSALFDVGTVVFVFLIGRRVYGTAVGLVAALVSALSVTQIQLAHFYAFDTFLAFFIAWSLYFAYRAWESGRRRDLALLGLGIGLATACKISALMLLALVPAVVLLPWPGRERRWNRRFVLDGLIVGLGTLLSYRVAAPYAFVGGGGLDFFRVNPKFVEDMVGWVKISSGEVEVPYTLQWTGTTPLLVVESIVRWGLGPAAGLASLAGLALAVWQLRRYDPPQAGRHLLLVGWALLTLGYFGFQFAKFMRYLLPVYPALAVLAGWLAVEAWRRARTARHAEPAERPASAAVRWTRPLRPLGFGVAPLVVLGSAVWALAFVQVYAEPNSRVAASRWILDNVPSGSALAVEHWDDAMPLNLPGKDRRNYREVSMPLYDTDNQEKVRKLVENLNRADYVILSSNRLYGSIPRLPWRYPMTIEYYRLLFSGELGYEKVAEFTSRPQLLGVEIVDDNAQEDFTVYDHPKVTVFQKMPAFEARRAMELLTAVPLDGVQRGRARQATGRLPLLTEAEWAAARAGGTWSALFDPDDLANSLAVPAWWLASALLGLAAWPLLWRLLPRFGPAVFGLARVIGLLLVAYLAWLLASLKLAPFGRASLLVGLLLVVVASVLALWRPGGLAAFRAHVRRAWPALLAAEGVFAAGFVVGLAMRLVNPDLWHPSYGGEKPMDFAYLNAVVKSDYFPPYDPWFAGGLINYYYFGFVLVAALIKLTGIVPSVAYNLAMALWMGLAAQAAFALAHSLFAHGRARGRLGRQALLAGGLAAVFVCLVGNLDGALQLRDALWKGTGLKLESAVPLLAGLVRAVAGLPGALRSGGLSEFDFWRSTRVIGPEDPGPITEFPFFTFLYGDLHAHLLALPLTTVAVALALELARARALGRFASEPRRRWRAVRLEVGRALLVVALLALVVGALRASNTWDYPTYLAIGALALGVALRPLGGPRPLARLALAGGLVVVLLALSSLLFAPYLERYQLGYTGVEPVKAHTSLAHFLTVSGFWLFVLLSWLVVELGRRAADRFRPLASPGTRYLGVALPLPLEWSLDTRWGAPAVAVVLVGLALFAIGHATLALLFLVGAGLVALAAARWQSGETLFLVGLALAALGIMAVPEVINLQGDIGRMNTVFKFHYQAWMLLAVISAGLLVRLALGPLARWLPSTGWRRAWLVALALVSAAVLVYPLRAPAVKLPLRFQAMPPTLDGMAFMERATYRDRDRDLQLGSDYEAIRWLQGNVAGSPVILEANTGLYKWGSRVSIYTGLPTVLGWDWHQKQQRVAMAERVEERLRDVRTIYETPRLEQALPLLAKYGVEYVYVGQLERAYYPAAGLRKLEEAPLDVLQPVYQSQHVTIYRVVAR